MSGAKRRFHLLLSFALPVCLYMLVMAFAKVYPFGENTLFLWDVDSQYVPFLTYWRGALTGGRDILYLTGNALGAGTADMVAYYLASPLNAIIFLFRDMVDAVHVLILLKIGLCGLTAYLYLRKTRNLGPAALFFSTSYALMGFVAVYFYNFIWLDGLILLPLAVLGYLRLAEGNAPFLYIAALALALLTQFYIGYMICLFMVLYLIYDLLTNKRKALRVLLTFAASSVLAAALGAALLYPAYLSIAQGPETMRLSSLSLAQVTTLRGVFTKVFTASSGVMAQRSGPPNIYVGIPLTLLALLYFFNRVIPLKQRLLSLGFVCVFLFSFLFSAPYFAWHAFESPTFYPARFSFLFSFLLINLAARNAEKLREFPPARLKWTIIIAVFTFTGLTGWVLYPLTVEYLAPKTILMDVAFFALSGLCVWLGCKKERWRRACVITLCAMQAVCLVLNSYYAYRRIGIRYTPTVEQYREGAALEYNLVERVREADPGLYRMEFDVHRTDNAAIAADFNGLSHNISVFGDGVYAFAKALGMREYTYHILYRSGMGPVVESLLSMKYLLRKDGNALEDLPEGYAMLWREGEYACYENTYAMPFACLAPPQSRELADDNPFVNQNLMLSALLGADAAVFEPVLQINRAFDGTWETETFAVQANRPLYMKSSGAAYRFNGGGEESCLKYQTMVLLPIAAEDTTYEVMMTPSLEIYLAYFDSNVFRQAMAALSAYGAQVESDTDSHLVVHANVTDDHSQLFISIPYDKGWHVWVDGKKAETVSRYGALLAVNLSLGEHTVELRFVPEGLWAGFAVSAAALAVFIAWMIIRRKKSR